MTARQVRALRGTAAALVATLVAGAAHTFGGGGAPSIGVLAAATVVASPVAIALIGRRAAVWRTSLAVGASQMVFHAGFAVFGSLGGEVHSAAMDGMVGSGMSPVAPPHHELFSDPGMLVAHVAAALVTIAVLHRGERMLRALARGIAHLLPAVEVEAAPADAPGPPLSRVPDSPARRTPSTDVRRRGPPLSFA